MGDYTKYYLTIWVVDYLMRLYSMLLKRQTHMHDYYAASRQLQRFNADLEYQLLVLGQGCSPK